MNTNITLQVCVSLVTVVISVCPIVCFASSSLRGLARESKGSGDMGFSPDWIRIVLIGCLKTKNTWTEENKEYLNGSQNVRASWWCENVKQLWQELFEIKDMDDLSEHSSILSLETSAFESLYGGQFTLSTQLIKPNYLVILPINAATPVL